jgi:CRISPR-associated endonuclease Cas1
LLTHTGLTCTFKGRSSRPAEDPFNAFLNYAYGVLYSRVEKALIIAGVDPFVGFMHRDDYNMKSMVFDFIEPYRIYAEETVFNQNRMNALQMDAHHFANQLINKK